MRPLSEELVVMVVVLMAGSDSMPAAKIASRAGGGDKRK